jgi:hypothetical protein
MCHKTTHPYEASVANGDEDSEDGYISAVIWAWTTNVDSVFS